VLNKTIIIIIIITTTTIIIITRSTRLSAGVVIIIIIIISKCPIKTRTATKQMGIKQIGNEINRSHERFVERGGALIV
jgi:c-di-AMP phosphodiesterase-like protein